MRSEERDQHLNKVHGFIERLAKRILSDYEPLKIEFGHSTDPVSFDDRMKLQYKQAAEGDVWGAAWDSAWFHLQGTVPEEWKGRSVVAEVELNGEALVFSPEGAPLQGLSNGSVFPSIGLDSSRTLFPFVDPAAGGEEADLWVEAAANALFGVNRDPDPAADCPTRHGSYEGKINRARLCVFETALWQLWLDMDVMLNLLEALPKESARRVRLLRGLSEAVNLFADDPENAHLCREHLQPLLKLPANASAPTINAVGHAHIDTAWLWPVRETIRKAARTFSSQLDLLERYPEYIFGASQPALYQFMKDHYRGLYMRIKQAVADGRWEPQGAMWVEADCNLISGESMVRQVIHGKNFFMDEFGVDVKNVWIPDVFGYSASMPQIMKRAGVDYFLTQKISWSQFNRFPHTTFRWRGIDGTELLTHFPPEDTYNSTVGPKGLRLTEEQFQEKDVLDDMMCLFGIGDGGGGPKAEHIERILRQRDLEGVPRVRFSRADEFFERIGKFSDELPVWAGELYLELHRATLTTQAAAKRGNRKLELALRETEYLCSCLPRSEYPQETLDGIWKKLLLNQFHDIIPGSSIHMVYEQTEKDYAHGLNVCDELREEAGARLFAEEDETIVIMNTLNCSFTQPVVLPQGWNTALEDKFGNLIPVQEDSDGTAVVAVELGPQEILTLERAVGAIAAGEVIQLVLENELVRYEFDEDGRITSARDKEQRRDILAGGCCGNVMTLYEDRPANSDAWDIDIYYEDQVLETAVGQAWTSLGAGEVRQGIAFELNVGNSTVTQEIYLAANSKRLDFRTMVNWCEKHRMLRTAFPVNVMSDYASFEIQYGHLRRPTHRNTSWDMARFEVAAHRYCDLSANDYGVALLNDCKYGHKIHENVIDLNLLRSPTHPDPDADIGTHFFTYSLLPHAGTLIESDVMAEAAGLNQPPMVFPGRRRNRDILPVTVIGEGVSLEVVKKAEKEDCLVIRLVETLGKDCGAEVTLYEPNARLIETDLMEWYDQRDLGSTIVWVFMKPFEIRTFKIARPKSP